MANLFEYIRTKSIQGYQWLKAKAIAIGETIQSLVDRYKKWRASVKRHQDYVDTVLDSKPEYAPEQVDIELSQRLKDKLGELHDGHILEHLKTLNYDQRKEYFEKVLLPLITQEMDLDIKVVEWFQDESTAGVYIEEKRCIMFNELFLTSDNDYILNVMINTIIHECKHAMQFDAIHGRNTHGYSIELIEKWRVNSQDYIQPAESDEGYIKQPLEWDANGFAESVYSTDRNL